MWVDRFNFLREHGTGIIVILGLLSGHMEFMDHLCQFGQFGIMAFRDGIQEVSGSIPLISTIEALKTIGFQGFLLFCGTFILPGTFLTRVLTRITKCPKNPICFKRSAVVFDEPLFS